MKSFGNFLWFIFVGLWSGIDWFICGIIWCITIIGIPFGRQCFKISKLMFFPFGKEINTNFSEHPIANVIWIIFGGLELCVGFFIVGAILCITIVGIPAGKQCFKLAKLSFIPFGAEIN